MQEGLHVDDDARERAGFEYVGGAAFGKIEVEFSTCLVG